MISPCSKKPPISVGALTGARIHTAEAAMDPQTHYPAIGCGTQGRFHGDLSFMPDRSKALR